MDGASTIVVNFDALNELSKRLQGIGTAFAAMPAHAPVDAVAVGSSTLADELATFLDQWSQGRQQVGAAIEAVVKAVHKALVTYEAAEQAVLTDEQVPSGAVSEGASGGATTGAILGQPDG